MRFTDVVIINQLVKQFPVGGDFFTALKKVDLVFSEGEFSGLVGPSGSGMTTLLNLIGGLDSPTEGTINVLNKSIANTSQAERPLLDESTWALYFKVTTCFLCIQFLKMSNCLLYLISLVKKTEQIW